MRKFENKDCGVDLIEIAFLLENFLIKQLLIRHVEREQSPLLLP